MFRIALTGGLGAGKSTAARFMRDRGLAVCDADDLAHACLRAGPCVAAIRERWGARAIRADGSAARDAIAGIVFADAHERAWLEACVHPRVFAAWEQWAQRHADAPAVVLTAPLLFEAGYVTGWHAIVCVAASETVCLARLRQRGMAPEDALRRMRAQWPIARKARLSDVLIWNDGTPALLEAQVRRVCEPWLSPCGDRAKEISNGHAAASGEAADLPRG